MTCRSIRGWLHRESDALDEAKRLVLEEHLQECTSCRAEREQLVRVREIGASLPAESIGPRGHGRAIARALMEGPRVARPARIVASWPFLTATVAIAIVIAVFAFRSGGADERRPTQASAPPERAPKPPPTALRDHDPPAPVAPRVDVLLVDGTLVQDKATTLRAGANVPADVTLHASTRARLRLYGSSVVIAANSDVRRASIDRAVLLLDAGSVEVDGEQVDVATNRFTVEIAGAATVAMRKVTVQHGSARIVDADGKVLTRIDAGGSWTLPDSHPVADRSASVLIDRARTAFAASDCPRAKGDADAALHADPSRTQAAEARTILAECAQATGALDDAVVRYEAIASRFADLPAGETALFAAARLEASRGRADAARTLSDRYLARYPSGRFADDARRLRSLP